MFIDGKKVELYQVYQQLLHCCKATSDYEYAMDTLIEMINLKPNDPQLYFDLAMLQLVHDNTKKAIKNFNKCLKLKPDFVEAEKWLNEAKRMIDK